MLLRAEFRALMRSQVARGDTRAPYASRTAIRRPSSGVTLFKSAAFSRRHRSLSTASPAVVAASSATSTSPSTTTTTTTFDLACPICHTTRFAVANAGERKPPCCEACGRTFDVQDEFLDLTLTSGLASATSSSSSPPSTSSSPTSSSSSSKKIPSDVERYWTGTQLFRSPLVAAAYDNGWRQGFAWAGFPGADEEFDAAMARIEPVARGEVVLDLSCGSGLFTRRFVRSGAFKGVIAGDYSEAMLRTAAAGLRADGADPSSYLPLRLDAARLPFANGSLAAVHAGAAIHCWPAPALAVAEVARVLRPGGIFVASTFLDAASPLEGVVGEGAAGAFRALLARPLEAAASRSAYRWWTESELRGMCTAAGLVDFRRWRSNRFILFSAKKRE